jgi:sec-independent protein translocase protein TatC
MSVLRAGRRRTPRADGGTMPLVEHLNELRSRLFKSAIALVIGMVVGFIVFPHVYHVLEHPYCQVPSVREHEVNGICSLNVFGILDPFKIKLQITFYTGLVLAAPVWLWQLWRFITPGLYRHERRWGAFFVAASLGLFAVGAYCAYLLLPTSLGALLGFGGHDTLNTLITATSYLKYVQGMLLVFGVGFEFPLVAILLCSLGILSGRRLLHWWRGFVLGITVFAAFAVPSPDPLSMLALAIPLWVLFFLSVGVCLLIDKRRARRRAAEEQRIADELGIDVGTLSVPFVDVPLEQ